MPNNRDIVAAINFPISRVPVSLFAQWTWESERSAAGVEAVCGKEGDYAASTAGRRGGFGC